MEKLKLIKSLKTLLLFIGLSLFTSQIYAQDATLRGRVTDQNGEALIGATVKVPGANGANALTDITGNFTLRTPASTSSLEVSYVGYTTYTVPVKAGASNLGNIILSPDANNLTEVVVVGYGTLKRQEVTGTTATIDAKQLQEIPAANINQQLQGRVAGLDVTNGNITIRGYRTIGNQGADRPLVVVDGTPFYNDINNINPQDIKSIDVLKGATSTAIYGSRGSGGVILVTTNRGRVGRTQANYDTYIGIAKLQGDLKTLDGAGYTQMKDDAQIGSIMQNTGNTQSNSLTVIERAALAEGINTNWVKLLIKPALLWDQTLRVSSGTDKTQFNVSTGYRMQKRDNLQDGNDQKRFSLNINVDHTINKVIKFGVTIDNTLRLINGAGGNQLGTLQWASPLSYPYNADGSIVLRPFSGAQDDFANPLLRAEQVGSAYYNYTRGFVNNNILYVEVKPIAHLTYKYTVNYNFSQSIAGNYNGINGVGITTLTQTSASTNNNYQYRLMHEHLLTYDNSFGKHSINFVGGFTAEKQQNQNSSMNATNIPADAIRNTNLSKGTFANWDGSWNERGLLSYFGRATYSFDNKYSLQGTMRADGNSTLAQGNQWTSYPSIGAAWTITNEQFMKKYTFIDNLKLRAGYGENSTASTNPYQTLGSLGENNYQYGGTSAGNTIGVRVTNIPNPKLTWQRTKEVNIALDFSLWKSRVSGSIEVYNQRTDDIIMGNSLPSTNGPTSQNSNLGSSNNKGIEFTVSTVNIQKSGFTWTSDFNIGFNREEIIKLPNGSPRIIGSGLFVGSPQSVIYDVKKIGIWQIADSPGPTGVTQAGPGGVLYPVYRAVGAQTSPLQYPGQIRVEDVNQDGKIDQLDNQIIGHFNPNYTFGFTNRFTYKGFDANIVITARMGFTTLVPYVSSSASAALGWQFLGTGRHNQPVLDYWTPTNQSGQWPAANSVTQSQFYSSLQYFDGSFIRAKAVNFGYTIPANVAKRIGLAGLRIYGSVTNPFVIYAPIRNQGFSVTDVESVSVSSNALNASGNVSRAMGLNAGTTTRDFIFGLQARF
jgi:TonB-linked SusC/RagA family outer membrane protein